jgi:hypothetical protein
VVIKVALGRVFDEHFGFPCRSPSHQLSTFFHRIVDVISHLCLFSSPGKEPPVPNTRKLEAGWAPDPVWTIWGKGKFLTLPGLEIRSLCCPARSQSSTLSRLFLSSIRFLEFFISFKSCTLLYCKCTGLFSSFILGLCSLL